MATENGDRLDSWKEIAAYFAKDERTVKRWETRRGLPVHRLPGPAGTTVYAYANELEAWLRKVDAAPAAADAADVTPSPAPARPATNGRAEALPVEVVAKPSQTGRLALVLVGAALVIGAVAFAARLGDTPERGADNSRQGAAGTQAVATSKRHVPNPKVADLYLQGVYYWNKRTPDSLNRAVHLFSQAIAEDPNYAEAFVGLANSYNLLREYTLMPAEEAYPKAKAAAERAVALDDTLAEAHTSLAFGEFFWFWNTTKALRAYERALELDPKSVTTHHWFATALMYTGEFLRALEQISEAQKLDPQSRSILADKGLILYYAGREDEAVQLLKRLADAEPDYLAPHAYLSAIYFIQGRYDDHLRMAKHSARLMEDEPRLALAEACATAYETGGFQALMAARLEGQRRLHAEGKEEAYVLAETYALMGDTEKALAYLRTSIDRHEQSALILRIDPSFRSLRSNEVFRAMVVEVGLPPITS